jgi:hypothetical protein
MTYPTLGPVPAAVRPPMPQKLRIGLWGSLSSGKTTYLAALNVASTRWNGPGHWIMNGADGISSDRLVEWTDLLMRQRTFPPATLDPQNLRFRFTGLDGEQRRQCRWALRPVPPQRQAFELDVPGGWYRDQPLLDDSEVPFGEDVAEVNERSPNEEDLIDRLASCSGLIYLFDPARDARNGDAFDFFHRTLERLARRAFEQVRCQGSRLPHHVAVCITKFDQPEVYKLARRYGLTVQAELPPGMPYVPDEHADEFFQLLCHSSRGNADMVRAALANYFDPAKIRVFVTSAVGFYVGERRRFRPNDYANVENGASGRDHIRGYVYPINVLEPLLWLQRSSRPATATARPW